MKNKILIKIIILFAHWSVIGKRGIIRKLFIILIRRLSKETGNMELIINKVPFIIHFDTDFKAIFETYNIREINFLRDNLDKKGVFIDLGANYGYYSQTISFHNLVEKIISIEPNVRFSERIKDSYSLMLNRKKNISPIFVENIAISDVKKESYLNLDLGFGSAFIEEKKNENSIKIQCDTLESIVKKYSIKKISGLKIDIEGHEDKALFPFFNNMNSDLYPKNILIEYTSNSLWKHDIILHLKQLGYIEKFRTKANMALQFNN